MAKTQRPADSAPDWPAMASTSLIPQPTPLEWQTAVEAMDKHDGGPMVGIFRQLGRPIELVDLAALARSEARRLEAIIAVDPCDPAHLNNEYELLRRTRPNSVEEAQKIVSRVAQLEGEIARNTSGHNHANTARHALATLRRFFRELFSDQTPPGAPWGGTLPPAILAAMARFPYGDNPQHWLDFEVVQPRRRRKVRAAGVFSLPPR